MVKEQVAGAEIITVYECHAGSHNTKSPVKLGTTQK
jgi:hypothetical protein